MNSNTIILIIGATGFAGQPVARQLQRDGYTVRILTRDRTAAVGQLGDKFTYIQGDIADEHTLQQALEGVTGVHLSLPSGHHPATLEQVQHQVAARVARLAAASGVRHVTYVSGYLVSERFVYIPAERAKLNAEIAIRTSGVPYTIFRPTYFTDMLPRFVQGKRASIFGVQPHAIRFLTLGDFAQMVSKAHQMPGTNRSFFVCGPEALTFEQALQTYVAKVDPGVQVSHAPFWMMRIMNRLFLRGQLTEILQLMAATQQTGEFGTPEEAVKLFGAAQTTVAAWSAAQVSTNRTAN
ncbi:MAG: NAD(P)H-binding protein [Chloroflexota bacterium]|nr:NAD(P)H-binding protein [Chloroflexota bacterium]